MILNKISLKTKIILLSLTILLLSSGVMIFGIFKLNNTVEHFTHVSEINLPNSESLSSMLSTEKDIFNYYLLLSMNNGSDQKSIYEHLKKHIEVYEKADLWYQGIPFVEGEDELYQPVSKSWKVFKGLIEDQVNGKKVDLNDVVKANDDFESKLMKLIEFQGSEAKKWSARAKEIAASTKWFQLVSVAILFVLATIVSVLIGSSLANQLKEIIALLTNISEAVESNSKSLSDSSNGISQAVVEQAASIEETAASLEEISSMIRKSTENARVTTEVSSQSQDKANEGKQVVEQMLSSMDSINSSNSEIENHILHSNEQMREIVRVIQEIGDKTKVINDIVFQTKLLSFNASVEAARAGEHGKGFAVVAEEVGSLASMSGNAAKEISDMLMNSMAKVENIVNETKAKVDQLVVQSKSSVQSGVEVANQCVIVLDEIVAQTVSVAQLSQEISTATQEQATGVGEINKAMNQLDQATQQNSTMAERTAKTAAELSSKAEQMRNIVDSLVVTVNGIE